MSMPAWAVISVKRIEPPSGAACARSHPAAAAMSPATTTAARFPHRAAALTTPPSLDDRCFMGSCLSCTAVEASEGSLREACSRPHAFLRLDVELLGLLRLTGLIEANEHTVELVVGLIVVGEQVG